MKAILDHVGIAVRNVDEALAFYRDALGLAIEPPEDVASQHVRAHFVPAGEAALELLESTASDSAIARYLEKRGPGLHHITLRVDDIDRALATLKAKGIRLVDEHPRAGAEGSRVAFIHPSSAHGVLVELKQPPAHPSPSVKSLSLGNLKLTVLHDGLFRLDGGAMFGIVPRPLWEKKAPPDHRNRIHLAMRPLMVEADWGVMLIDCGAGDKWTDKERDIYAFDRRTDLDDALQAAGKASDDIDLVVATHLHFDHFGGATIDRDGKLVPRFARARYAIRKAEWEDATHPHERNRGSYLQRDFVPLEEHGVIDFFDADIEIRPGVEVIRTGGHTGQHQVVYLRSGEQTVLFPADLIPTAAHVADAWIMGYDLFPTDTLEVKHRVIREAIDRGHLVVFEHDPEIPAGYIRERDGTRFVEPV